MGGLQWLAYHLFSFELLLVLFLYGVRLEALLPSTPLPETVFYGALSLVVGVWIILRQGIYRGGLPIVIAGILFSGWMVASYGWSPSRILARESLPFIMGVNLWAIFAAACIVAGSRERMLRLLILMMLIAVGLSLYGTYIEHVIGSFRFYYGPNGDWHHRTYLNWGNFICIGAAVALAIMIYSRFGSAKQLLAAAAFGICFYFLLFNGARGAMLGTMLAGIAPFMVNMPTVRRGTIEISPALLVALVAIVAVAGYIGYLFSIGEAPTTFNRFMRLFDQADDPLLRTSANRFDYFAGAYRIWLTSPIIGQGLYGFAITFCGFDQPGCHPHNVLLHALADFGLIGLILFLAFLWTGLRHCKLDRLRQDPLRMTLVMACITIAMYALVAVDLPTDHRVFFFIGLLALREPPAELPDEDDDESATDDA